MISDILGPSFNKGKLLKHFLTVFSKIDSSLNGLLPISKETELTEDEVYYLSQVLKPLYINNQENLTAEMPRDIHSLLHSDSLAKEL